MNKRLFPALALIPLALALVPHTALAADYTYQGMLNILYNLVEFLLRIAAFACVAVLAWFGLKMVLSRGDQTKFADAKKGLTWAIIGTVVIFGVYTIIATIKAAVDSVGR